MSPKPSSKDGDLENQGKVTRIFSTLYCVSGQYSRPRTFNWAKTKKLDQPEDHWSCKRSPDILT